MNKLEELEKQYAKLGEEIEKLKKGKAEKYFMPEEEEAYYFLASDGYDSYHYYADGNDIETLKRQIPCKTEEEVKFYDQKRIYETQYRKYLLDHEEELVNWEDKDQDKYSACYDYRTNEMSVDRVNHSKYQGEIYTTREESITEFAKEIGEDNFIKYILIGEYKGEE